MKARGITSAGLGTKACYVAVFILALMLASLTLLTGCGSSSNSNASKDNAANEQKQSSEQSSSSDTNNSTKTGDSKSGSTQQKSSSQSNSGSTSTKTETNPHLTWTTIKSDVTDSDGYTLRFTIKLSPWILFTNTADIDAAWKVVGQGNTLPRTIEEWGGSSTQSAGYFTDMYYCLGDIQIENVTDGWDATSANPISTHVGLTWSGEPVGALYYQPGSNMFYSNGMKSIDRGHTLTDWHTLTSNKRGPIPFVLAFPENITPKNPEGEFYPNLLDSKLILGELGNPKITGIKEVQLGVIGKDGKYYAPNGD